MAGTIRQEILNRCFEENSTTVNSSTKKSPLNFSGDSTKTTSSTLVMDTRNQSRRSSTSSTDSNYSWVYENDPSVSSAFLEPFGHEATVRRNGRRKNAVDDCHCSSTKKRRLSTEESPLFIENEDPLNMPSTSGVTLRTDSVTCAETTTWQNIVVPDGNKSPDHNTVERTVTNASTTSKSKRVTFRLPTSPIPRPHRMRATRRTSVGGRDHATLERGRSFSCPPMSPWNGGEQNMMALRPSLWKIISTSEMQNVEARSSSSGYCGIKSKWAIPLVIFALCIVCVTIATASLVYIRGLQVPGPCIVQGARKDDASESSTGKITAPVQDHQQVKKIPISSAVGVKTNQTGQQNTNYLETCKKIKDVTERQRCLKAGQRSRSYTKSKMNGVMPAENSRIISLKNIKLANAIPKQSKSGLSTFIKNALAHAKDEVVLQTDEETALIVLFKRKP